MVRRTALAIRPLRQIAGLLLLLALSSSCGEEAGSTVPCGAVSALPLGCEPSVVDAIDRHEALRDFAVLEPHLADSVDGVISEIRNSEILVDTTDQGSMLFRWPGVVPEGLAIGEQAAIELAPGWIVLRTASLALAVLLVDSYAGRLEPQPPGGGPSVTFEAACQVDAPRQALALRVELEGDERRILPGEATVLGSWTVANLGSYVADYNPGTVSYCLVDEAKSALREMSAKCTLVWRAGG